MAVDKKLSQRKIVQVPEPKAVLTLFIIEYDLNCVSGLKAENVSKEVPSSNLANKIFKESFFREY